MKFLTKLYYAIVDKVGFGTFAVIFFATPFILMMLAASLYFRRKQAQEARVDDRRNSLDLLEQGQLDFVRARPLPKPPKGPMPPMVEDCRGPDNANDPRETSIDVTLTMDKTRESNTETVASPVPSSERFYEAHDIEGSTGRSE